MTKQKLRILSSNIIIILAGAALFFIGLDKQNTAMMCAGALLCILGMGRFYLLNKLLGQDEPSLEELQEYEQGKTEEIQEEES